MAIALVSLSLLVLLHLPIEGAKFTMRVVDENLGQDKDACLTNSSHYCQSLAFALNKTTLPNNTVVILQSPGVNLTGIISLKGFSNISLLGNNCSDRPVIDCHNVWKNPGSFGAGFAFYDMSSLTIRCVQIVRCGALQVYENGTLNVGVPFRSAVYTDECCNILFSHVIISQSNGIGLVLFEAKGIINIAHSHFYHNTAWKNCSTVSSQSLNFNVTEGGGAININYAQSYSEYFIVSCAFYYNEKNVSDGRSQSQGNGAGILLKLGNTTSHTCFILKNSSFSENSADWGGALFIGLTGSVHNNTIELVSITFSNNFAKFGGGGLDIGFFLFDEVNPVQNNVVLISNCLFEQNVAYYGGGSTLFSDQYSQQGSYMPNNVTFDNCVWESNFAKYSAAVDVSPNVYDNIAGGYLLKPVFSDCSFSRNKITPIYTRSGKQVFDFGSGIFLITAIDVKFDGVVEFSHNNGTALQIVSARAIFKSRSFTTFVNNSGSKGGAVALMGLAYLEFKDSIQMHFFNNCAQFVGGAVYSYSIDQHDYFSSCTCMFRRSSNREVKKGPSNATFVFLDNSAKSGIGHSIFATTLKPCKFSGNVDCRLLESAEEVLSCSVANFTFDDPLKANNIATIGYTFENITQSETLIPGKEVSLNPIIWDEMNNSVNNITVFHSYLSDKSHDNIKLSLRYEYSPTGTIQLTGNQSNTPFDLVIETSDILGVSINIKGSLSECPPGLVNEYGMCVCAARNYTGLTRCNTTSMQAYIVKGFWIGYLNNSGSNKSIESTENIFTSYCPPGYCVYNSSVLDCEQMYHEMILGEQILPDKPNSTLLDNFLCGSSRTGTLCGRCNENYSVGYHSKNYECIPDTCLCKYGILLYFATNLFPLTVLFIVALLLDVSFTSGTMNGFIFYSQLIDLIGFGSNGVTTLFKQSTIAVNTYEALYGFFNMQFFTTESTVFSFCLWQGASVLDAMALKYATTLYALVLVVSLVLVLDYCNCYPFNTCLRKHSFHTSLVRGLSTFLIMSYSQCVKVTFEILNLAKLTGINGNDFRVVVYRNGNFRYFGADHLPYAIPALVVLTVLVIPLPVILICTPLMLKFSARLSSSSYWLRSVQYKANSFCLIQLKPLFDSFQGCFRDNCRCFAGLYLLYRILIVALLVFLGPTARFYTISSLLFAVFLAIHCVVQPYQSPRHNIIDALLLINLLLICNTSVYALTIVFGVEKVMNHSIQWAQVILICTPISCFIFCSIYQAIKKVRSIAPNSPRERNESDWPARLLLSEETTDSDGNEL